MTELSFRELRAGTPECPSDLALDRLIAGELAFEHKRELERHTPACPACQRRMAERRAGFDPFAELDAEEVLRRVEAARTSRGPESQAPRLLRRAGILAGLSGLALAGAALVIGLHSDALESTATGTRLKGALSLRVYRQRGDGSEEVASGEAFHAGDRLRFRISTPSVGFVSILGVEADGTLYTAWPLAPASERQLPAQRETLLDEAVALDASLGRETLWLLHCPNSGAHARCVVRDSAAALSCPSACGLTPFRMVKTP